MLDPHYKTHYGCAQNKFENKRFLCDVASCGYKMSDGYCGMLTAKYCEHTTTTQEIEKGVFDKCHKPIDPDKETTQNA
jgi:hypothetical protein